MESDDGTSRLEFENEEQQAEFVSKVADSSAPQIKGFIWKLALTSLKFENAFSIDPTSVSN